jgi:hypothetical protein
MAFRYRNSHDEGLAESPSEMSSASQVNGDANRGEVQGMAGVSNSAHSTLNTPFRTTCNISILNPLFDTKTPLFSSCCKIPQWSEVKVSAKQSQSTQPSNLAGRPWPRSAFSASPPAKCSLATGRSLRPASCFSVGQDLRTPRSFSPRVLGDKNRAVRQRSHVPRLNNLRSAASHGQSGHAFLLSQSSAFESSPEESGSPPITHEIGPNAERKFEEQRKSGTAPLELGKNAAVSCPSRNLLGRPMPEARRLEFELADYVGFGKEAAESSTLADEELCDRRKEPSNLIRNFEATDKAQGSDGSVAEVQLTGRWDGLRDELCTVDSDLKQADCKVDHPRASETLHEAADAHDSELGNCRVSCQFLVHFLEGVHLLTNIVPVPILASRCTEKNVDAYAYRKCGARSSEKQPRQSVHNTVTKARESFLKAGFRPIMREHMQACESESFGSERAPYMFAR